MKKRKRATRRKNVYEREREQKARVGVYTGRGGEALMAKEEQSQFIPRAFVNLPREHIMAAWSFQQTEMRKVGGWFRSFVVDMDVTRCLIVSTMKGGCGGVDEL